VRTVEGAVLSLAVVAMLVGVEVAGVVVAVAVGVSWTTTKRFLL
jgi:hypothetical protein